MKSVGISIWKLWGLAVVLAASSFLHNSAMAQVPGRYFPLDHRQPAGVAARWSSLVQPGEFGRPQPIQVALEGGGHVSFYQGNPHNPVAMAAPATATMSVGHVYRIRISDMPQYPGVELFPSIEVVDRLHPPAGSQQQFPVPIEITTEEIEAALHDGMVTKVIYLEQPDFAMPLQSNGSTPIENLPVADNLMAAADHRGRPLAILKLGGRIPDPNSPNDEFYSRSPISFVEVQSPAGQGSGLAE
ncbi:MAG: hypothetical protein R3C18_22710 [Planctomycetaceae bacterium]